MSWLFFAILAPALWAITNLIDDILLRRAYPSPRVAAGASGLITILTLLVPLYFGVHRIPFVYAFLAFLAGILIILTCILYYRSLQADTPSVTVAIWGLAPAFLPFFAYSLLGEVLSLRQYVGFCVMLLAAFLLSAPDWRKMRFSKALPLMLLAALLTAAIVLLEKGVYREVDFWSGCFFVLLGMVVTGAALLLFCVEGRDFLFSPERWRRFLPFILATEVLGGIANIASSYAIKLGPVSLVQVVKGVQPVFVLFYTVLLAPFFPSLVRESWGKHAAQKFAFMATMLAGLYLIRI